jgi:hypothetical protein
MTDNTSYAPVFDNAESIYAAIDIDSTFVKSLEDFEFSSPNIITGVTDLLKYLPDGNEYLPTYENLDFTIDKDSLDSKDSQGSYTLSFNKGNLTVSEVTVTKDLGKGNDNIKEDIVYTNELGDKYSLSHDYITATTSVVDPEDDMIVTITKQNFSNSLTESFSAENGLITSNSTHTDTYAYTDTDGVTSLSTKSVHKTEFKSPEKQISEVITTEEKSKPNSILVEGDITNDTIAIHDSASEDYTKNTNTDYSYKDEVYSLVLKQSNDAILTKFAYSDKFVKSLDVVGAILSDADNIKTVSKDANLKLVTDNFTLTSKALNVDLLTKFMTEVTDDYYNEFVSSDTSNEIVGTNSDDSIVANPAKKILATSMIRSNSGLINVKIDGQEGNDTISGGNGNDELIGGAGKDVLTGVAGNDTLDGSEGDDILNGGSGNDELTGGDGKDKFIIDNKDSATVKQGLDASKSATTEVPFDPSIVSDSIQDFVPADDSLVLGFVGTKANVKIITSSLPSSVTATDFANAVSLANSALAKATGKERAAFVSDDEHSYVFNDTNGDGKADQFITFTGVVEGFTVADIVA